MALYKHMRVFKQLDFFGVPIRLFHKNKRTYHTIVGGCATLWLSLCIFIFMSLRLSDLINRTEDKITIGSLYYSSLEE